MEIYLHGIFDHKQLNLKKSVDLQKEKANIRTISIFDKANDMYFNQLDNLQCGNPYFIKCVKELKELDFSNCANIQVPESFTTLNKEIMNIINKKKKEKEQVEAMNSKKRNRSSINDNITENNDNKRRKTKQFIYTKNHRK